MGRPARIARVLARWTPSGVGMRQPVPARLRPASSATFSAGTALALVALVLLPLIAGAVSATPGPNPRPPLATVGNVLQVSVATTGTILAVTDDPGSTLPTPNNPGPAVATWYIWDRAGASVHTGSADLAACASRLGDLCQSPAAAGSISSDGTRFAVGSNLAMSPLDATRGLVQAGYVSDGQTVRQFFQNPIAQVAMDKRGQTIAVLETLPATPGPGQTDRAQVNLFAFDGLAFTAIFPPFLITAPATGMALSIDGARLAVAADHLYIFARANLAPAINTAIAGAVTSVSVAAASPHAILAGYASGTLALFTDAGGATAEGTLNLGSAITATATQGAAGLAGDTAGKVHLVAITDFAPRLTLQKTVAQAPDAVRQLVISNDGAISLLRSATEVQLLQLAPGNLTELWRQTPALPPVGGGLDEHGDLAAVGVAAGVVAFDVSHDVRADAPQTFEVPPHVARDLEVVYRNTGNRAESVQLGAAFPPNWFMTVTPNAFDLNVGQSATVAVHFVVGDNERPGLTNLVILHDLASGGSGTTTIPVQVVARDAVGFGTEGPASVAMQRGETVRFKVTLENRGTADASVDVEATLNRPTWIAQVTPRHFELAPDAISQLEVALTAPLDAADGEQANVRLTLAGRPGAELDLVGVVGARFEPSIVAPGRANVAAGTIAQVNVTVRNAGNVADRFDVTVTGILPDGWKISLQDGPTPRSPILEPGAAARFTVLVEVPEGANGQRVQLRLQAASLGDSAKLAEHVILVMVDRDSSDQGQGTPFPTAVVMAALLMAVALRRLSRRPAA